MFCLWAFFSKTEYSDYSFADNLVTEKYVTSEDFRKLAAIKVNTFCEEHSILGIVNFV